MHRDKQKGENTMSFYKKIVSFIGITVLFISLSACGSSGSPGGDITPEEQAEISNLIQTIGALADDLSEGLTPGSTTTCTGGGTITVSVDGSTVTFTNCSESGLVINGKGVRV